MRLLSKVTFLKCKICDKNFRRKSSTQIFCSNICHTLFRNSTRQISDAAYEKRKTKKRFCRFCNKPYFRRREKHGFCSLNCSSTFYSKTDAYKKFLTYVKQSKVQKEIFEFIKRNINENILFETSIKTKNRIFFPDILIPKIKTIIEFNGDYWHCNPFYFNSSYWHEYKKKTANEIWFDDENRVKILNSVGYNIITVWENDYMKNKASILNSLLECIKYHIENYNSCI